MSIHIKKVMVHSYNNLLLFLECFLPSLLQSLIISGELLIFIVTISYYFWRVSYRHFYNLLLFLESFFYRHCLNLLLFLGSFLSSLLQSLIMSGEHFIFIVTISYYFWRASCLHCYNLLLFLESFLPS